MKNIVTDKYEKLEPQKMVGPRRTQTKRSSSRRSSDGSSAPAISKRKTKFLPQQFNEGYYKIMFYDRHKMLKALKYLYSQIPETEASYGYMDQLSHIEVHNKKELDLIINQDNRMQSTYNIDSNIRSISKTGDPPPKYVFATENKQDANIIGYRPKSEKLVWMTPQMFKSLTVEPISYDKDALKTLKQKIQSGEPLDALWLDVDVKLNKVLQHE